MKVTFRKASPDDPIFREGIQTFVPAPRPPSRPSDGTPKPPRVIDPSDELHEAIDRAAPTAEEKIAMFGSKPSASKPPLREDFDSQEDFEEALSRWRWTVGRNRAFAERATRDAKPGKK